MNTFVVDKTKAKFINEKIKQRISDLSYNNSMFLPCLNSPNKEKFWEVVKDESIFVQMAIAIMFGEKMDIFAGCKVLPFKFWSCEAVLEFNLSNTVEDVNQINGSTFPNLSVLNISENNKSFSLIDGALFSVKNKRILCYPPKRTNKEFIIPKEVKAIERHCFTNNEYIEKIVIAEGLTKIGTHCFSGCKSLKSINIPSTVKDISRSAFRDDEQLISIEIPHLIKEIKDNLFDSCTSLKSVTFGDGVESICLDAFRNCSSLTNIYLPDSVRYIHAYAFHMCKSLCKVSLPKDIKTIDGSAFAKCDSLTAIDYRGTMEQWNRINIRWKKINYKNAIKTIKCSDGIIQI